MNFPSYEFNKFFEDDQESDLEKLLLPNFQREFQWDRQRQKRLLASFLVNIPIGSMLLLKGEGEEFATRKIGFRENDKILKERCTYLLDGQQRFSTLTSIFGLIFGKTFKNWELNYEKLYPQLQTTWFININVDKEDPFGFKYLKFDAEKIKRNDPEIIEEYIDYEIIYKKKNENKWYHPNFIKNLEESGKKFNTIKRELAKKAGLDCKIPLFGLLNSQYEIHDEILKEIADIRAKDLDAEIKGDRNIIDKIFEDPENVKELYDDPDINSKAIVETWANKKADWAKAFKGYLDSLCKQEIPVILLYSKEIDRAVPIFDNMNKGGIALSTYDLIVAKAAQKAKTSHSLTSRIVETLQETIQLPPSLKALNIELPKDWSSDIMHSVEEKMPSNVVRKQFLNILSLIHFLNQSKNTIDDLDVNFIKRSKILALSSDEINKEYKIALNALIRVFAFLQWRCGIYNVKQINYELMVLPLALILVNDSEWTNKSVIDKLEAWYWSSIFGGRYREKQNSRAIEDSISLYKYIYKNDKNPSESIRKNIFNDIGYSDFKQLSYQNKADKSVPSKIKNSILQYVLSKYPSDLLPENEFESSIRLSAYNRSMNATFKDISGKEYFHDYQAHHIIPLSDARKINESTSSLRASKNLLNSPLNLTYISAAANSYIGPKSPRDYVVFLDELDTSRHLFPHSFEKEVEESDNDYYLRMIKERFENLQKEMKKEIDDLDPIS